ncbi:LLM class flavin-dependent oxidoreductase [Rhodococcus triatomae]|uniref:FMN-dependent oxidoreductase, nitrilotriacetate monooxygenase family n=1 Tax=Rhodococcus triatomae TaxID=300028 RepID=A0A1G8AV87_9NOCA|nr:LLM class flavin-dependent oxidoreductase [Rhodococcus triatomae]QNG17662.1 LLM class flavin-dependent oxidoreductase [Rhodococcus triatomae]QNG22671.1 LLM class flavin-dependent oxidoreductase [Rhodococcus triatomae]SDH24879.1 FMN-dependent oxidoreductase, nitrilotriacetate monooxygenase family [Rhodococcus triatomae]
MTKQFHLNAFLMGVGHHEAAWRHPRTDARRVLDVTHFQELGRIAERGKLDSVFFADGLAVGPRIKHNSQAIFEPVTLLSAIAVVTERVGLIATASTSYGDPYHLARKFASLDHISGGRAGWNIVTSAGADEAANFGLDGIPQHRGRYERAEEFVDVALALWDSWEDGAVVLDRESGVFADPVRVHPVDHVGERFRVRGPLNSPRSEQGRPLLVQAGSSESGKEFAARHAEAVFTAQRSLDQGQEFYRDLKARVVRHGRHPDELKVLPGIVPFIADTEEEAKALEQSFTDLISPEYSLRQLSTLLGVDLTEHALDAPLPPLPPLEQIEGHKSRYQLVRDLAESESLTVRELIARLGGGRGHRTFAGTPEQIADELQVWFEQGAADGFNIMPPYLPGGLEDFVDRVVPILQQRGLFRTDYAETTLRGHYGLAEPGNRFAADGGRHAGRDVSA